jgi:hypothetical protein
VATIKPAPHRSSDVTNWVLTSIAASLLFHVLLVHFFGGIGFFDTEVFKSAVSRWFSIVDLPLPEPPEFSTALGSVATQADQPQAGDVGPNEIPLIGSEPRMASPAFGSDSSPGAPSHPPVQVRLPDTNLPVVHGAGSPDVDQTLLQVGEIAPIPTRVRETPPATVPRPMATAAPGLPATPRASMALPEVSAPKPVTPSQAGELAPPTIKPSTTQALVGAGIPSVGIEIPIQEVSASQDIPAPRVVIKPTPEAQEPVEDARPVVPLADEVSVKVTLYAEPGDPSQYFRMEIAVAKPDQLPVIPKDVMFIVDVSMSIHRHNLRVVREAIVGYLRTLRAPDRFNVVVFSSDVRKLFPSFAEPSPERVGVAEAFIDRISGQIRTDVYGALTAVICDIAQNSAENRPTNIFFISDGYSTSGIRDARRIVNEISTLARPNFAIFPFDAGRTSHRYLLDLLAYRTRGRVTFTEGAEEAAKVAPSLFRSFDKPVLMDLRPLFTNLQVEDTYPAFLPNLYADQPIVFYGRCTPGQNVTVQLQGTNPIARRSFVYSQAPGAPDPSQSEIAREWARRKIHHIVSDMARQGETPDLKAELQRLAAKYHVPTPYGQ